jgi:hypothetical protein
MTYSQESLSELRAFHMARVLLLRQNNISLVEVKKQLAGCCLLSSGKQRGYRKALRGRGQRIPPLRTYFGGPSERLCSEISAILVSCIPSLLRNG